MVIFVLCFSQAITFHFLISTQITDLPFSLYSTFVIEARHGFNKVCIHYSIFLSYLISCDLFVSKSLFGRSRASYATFFKTAVKD